MSETPTCPNPDVLQETFDKLDACIHCGMCLPACPTYLVTGSEAESPRGRLVLMRAFFEGTLDSPKQLSDHLDPCLGCLGCMTACPSGVRYNTVLTHSREALVGHQPKWKRELRRFMLGKVLPNRRWLGILVGLTKAYRFLGYQMIVRRLGLWRLGGHLGKIERFVPVIQSGKPQEVGAVYGENRRGRVALFIGCIMNAAYAQTQQATIDALVANGYQVTIPPQTCCGALAHHAGETDIATDLARENVRLMLAENSDWIVVNAAGCGSTLREIDHILTGDADAARFQAKVIDFVELLSLHPLEGPLRNIPWVVTYHAACHLHHAQAVHKAPYTVLEQIPGLKLVPLLDAELCCGSAGVYNLAHPDLSMKILAMKTEAIDRTGADVVLAENPGCMLQLEAGFREAQMQVRVMHPADILALAYAPLPTGIPQLVLS